MTKLNVVTFCEPHSDTNLFVSDHLMHVPWVQQSHWKAKMTKEGTSVLLALFVSLLCQTRVLDINSVNKMVGSHLELAAIMKVI